MTDNPLSRREFLKGIGAGAVALSMPMSGLLAATSRGRKPNIILILADDLGYGELGCQGGKDVTTPNIDSIAKNGVRFTDGYVSCPVCSPTRAGLMTGRYQTRFGHELNPGPAGRASPDFGLPLKEKTIADYLKDEGYVTGVMGKWHLGYQPAFHPRKRGFDEFFGFLGGAHSYVDARADGANPIMRGTEAVDGKEYLTDAFGREAVAFVDQHKGNPFFLFLSFNAVHGPLQDAPKYADKFTEIEDKKRRTFARMLKSMDDAVGSVLAKLRENGLEEDTLIIFLSDNGGPTRQTTSGNGPLSGQKGQVLEGGIRVPFMMQWKGRLPSGVTSEKPVISLDMLPTVVAAAGGTMGSRSGVDGVDLLPYVSGKRSGVPHDKLFWRFGPQSAMRAGDWKLLKREDGSAELYNLASDIGEATDLASKNPEKVEELEAVYNRWNTLNRDPLWQRPRRARRRRARQG